MPTVLIGYGSPMNAIQDNDFTRSLARSGRRLDRPKAVLVAHWLTPGRTMVAVSPAPETIHDFGGFPDELFQVRYPAPGAPEAARKAAAAVTSVQVHADHEMGSDHGAWSVLKHIWPAADVPVFQMSLNWGMTPAEHHALSHELKALRHDGILVLGSGNVVHNLGRLNWSDPSAPPYDRAQEFDAFVEGRLAAGDHQALVDYSSLGAMARLAHPTNDHSLPLLYTLGTAGIDEPLTEPHSGPKMGSISMRSFMQGPG
ncbi:MAG: 4,5-DOPA dioxygenase extradiol [Flavobacteriales bacterium]|nr:4,5-DOPA dioxygenase extradiol [Flavobacteriales bacterium]MBK9699126.1 4,5-DOPA dioxygenase extradiol [Flavobacteriales bacterium]